MDLDRYLIPFQLRQLPLYRFDVVVLGSGVAGNMAALSAASAGASVALIAKDTLAETNTSYAQGGVAAVLGPDDSYEIHVADTLAVGCGLSEVDAVERVVRGGPAAIDRLIEWGARFDLTRHGMLDLSREGGHSRARIVHAGGAATGAEIQRTLNESVATRAEVTTFERTMALDLFTDEAGRAIGVLCQSARGELVVFAASEIVLATGGAGQVFRETTNPSIATGDGLAMALRAGAAVRDLEFFQFHPTCLYIAGAARVLVSEIVRGAGGKLLDKSGVRFMPEYDEKAELAPRDVVSRACFDRMVKTGDTNVYLDLSDLERDPHELFPGISRICHYFGIDIAKNPIPVRPGAHYMIGGIRVDLDGRTNVAGLWAVGECASSGLHGANRMGSNSLLEGLVLGARAGELAATKSRGAPTMPLDQVVRHDRAAPPKDVRINIEDMTYSLKALMWRQMGIVRTGPAIQDARDKIRFWTRAVIGQAATEPKAFELVNMLTVAGLMATSALAREESRGAHFRIEFPKPTDAWRAHTVLQPSVTATHVRALELSREPVLEATLAR
ncbi:MAG: L-aspartate oxidase [Planctomycetes bacterium]|nr:L-aspartate oxidase [Planctomycetota bacterium]